MSQSYRYICLTFCRKCEYADDEPRKTFTSGLRGPVEDGSHSRHFPSDGFASEFPRFKRSSFSFEDTPMKKTSWESTILANFEKDFYKEHPDVANRSDVG